MFIEVRNVTKTIKGVTLLSEINLSLKSGQIYGLIGKNGSGKTMLLRAVSGLILPSSGEIVIDQKVLHKDLSFPENLGILIEKPEFLNHLTGFENLKSLASIKRLVSDVEIKEYMKLFDLDPNDKKKIKKYSLGMKQKIGVIQAIMEKQSLLILDEPFNGLDEKSVMTLHQLLCDFRDKDYLIIITSHHKEDIEMLCDVTYDIVDGRIQEKPITTKQSPLK